MRRTSVFAITAVLLPASFTLGACSSSSSAGATAAASASSSSTASPAAASPTPTAPAQSASAGPPLTGTQLKSYLAPAGDFPDGYTSTPQETQDTGDAYEPQSISPPPTPTCALFDTNGIITVTGYNPVSFAQGDYRSASDGGEYAQEIDVFQGTAAQDLMTALAAAARACSTYPDSETSTTATVTQTTTFIGGYTALVFTTSDPQWKAGLTIEAVRIGNTVVTVMVSNGESDDGGPEATNLAATIVANLTAKS
ncbi:MAG TPA: hypothetical protein VGX23_06825 [Actinocrinis sp.]|nr:hypothetical protein [Actinocrinis sp.]